VKNVRAVILGVTITSAGVYTLRIKINGKNAASGGHDSYVSWACLAPT
jgi:hypothetical protein